MKKSASRSLAAAALVAILSGCATGGGGGGWITLVDGTKGLDNFNRVGEANWTPIDGAIQPPRAAKRPPTWSRRAPTGTS